MLLIQTRHQIRGCSIKVKKMKCWRIKKMNKVQISDVLQMEHIGSFQIPWLRQYWHTDMAWVTRWIYDYMHCHCFSQMGLRSLQIPRILREQKLGVYKGCPPTYYGSPLRLGELQFYGSSNLGWFQWTHKYVAVIISAHERLLPMDLSLTNCPQRWAAQFFLSPSQRTNHHRKKTS